MKHILLILMLAFVLQACENPGESLEDKKKELAEKQTELQKLRDDIEKLNRDIAKLDTGAGRRENATLVVAQPIETGEFHHYIEIQGSAESKQNVQVYPEVAGQVQYLAVKEGTKVQKGQLLAKIDDDVMTRNIDELRTSYELAKTTFDKQEKLWKQNIGSEMQYLQAKTQKESLENRIKSAEAQLAKTRITAPISGVVDDVMLNQGEMANPMQPIFRVVNLDQIEISAEVSERYLGQIHKGDTAVVHFPNLNISRKAPVNYVSQVINPGDRTFSVNVIMSNKDQMIKPNVIAVLKLNDYSNSKAVIVPTNVIQQSTKGPYLYITKETGGRTVASKVYIETGDTYNKETEVLSGLTGNEQIITRGYQDLTDGALIQLKEEITQGSSEVLAR